MSKRIYRISTCNEFAVGNTSVRLLFPIALKVWGCCESHCAGNLTRELTEDRLLLKKLRKEKAANAFPRPLKEVLSFPFQMFENHNKRLTIKGMPFIRLLLHSYRKKRRNKDVRLHVRFQIMPPKVICFLKKMRLLKRSQ